VYIDGERCVSELARLLSGLSALGDANIKLASSMYFFSFLYVCLLTAWADAIVILERSMFIDLLASCTMTLQTALPYVIYPNAIFICIAQPILIVIAYV
jgi:hypothetical protein